MKKAFFFAFVLLVISGIAIGLYFIPGVAAGVQSALFGDEPDLPDFAKYKIDKSDFMTRRGRRDRLAPRAQG